MQLAENKLSLYVSCFLSITSMILLYLKPLRKKVYTLSSHSSSLSWKFLDGSMGEKAHIQIKFFENKILFS